MLAMHYAFTLDDDHDMTAIRRRAAEKSARFDGYPGLAFKAFVVNEKGDWKKGEPARNLYGAFYLWHTEAAARTFLTGPDFAAVTAAFGRPEVRTWLPLGRALPLGGPQPRHLTFERFQLRRDEPPASALAEVGSLDEGGAYLVAGFTGLDPSTWEAVRVRLWQDAEAVPEAASRDRSFEVLHLSTAESALRPQGPLGPGAPLPPVDRAARERVLMQGR